MTDDESVDGPGIAAAILNKLPPERRAKLMSAIESTNPQIATKITASLFTFDELQDISAQGIQVLLREVAQADLVLSLKKITDKTKAVIMENLSERKQKIVLDELSALPPTPVRDVEQAQRRILEKLEELRTSGAIRTKSKNDVWV